MGNSRPHLLRFGGLSRVGPWDVHFKNHPHSHAGGVGPQFKSYFPLSQGQVS